MISRVSSPYRVPEVTFRRKCNHRHRTVEPIIDGDMELGPLDVGVVPSEIYIYYSV